MKVAGTIFIDFMVPLICSTFPVVTDAIAAFEVTDILAANEHGHNSTASQGAAAELRASTRVITKSVETRRIENLRLGIRAPKLLLNSNSAPAERQRLTLMTSD